MIFSRGSVPAFLFAAGLTVFSTPLFAEDIDPQDVPGMPQGVPQYSPPGVQDGVGEVIPGRRQRQQQYQSPQYQSPMVVGPGGVIPQQPPRQRRVEKPKPKPLTPEEKAAQIRKALAPHLPFAVARRATLDKLYAKLAVAGDAEEAKGLAGLITNIWLRSPSDTAALLVQRAMIAAEQKQYDVSLGLLDQVVQMQPQWAEAWNKRATARYLSGDLNGSMEDVEHVLKLEPNHFAALEGMAMILHKTGFDKRALQVYRRALTVYPHQPDVEELVKKLTLEVEGQGI